MLHDELRRSLRRFLPGSIVQQVERDYYADPAKGLAGKSDPNKRVRALLPVVEQARNQTVLDLGCAEGLMLQPFLAGGARFVHGVDESYRRVRSARRFFGTARSRFDVVDLNQPHSLQDRNIFLPVYDTVLFLGVYQHLKPKVRNATLAAALGMARQIFLIRCPKPLLDASLKLIRSSGFRVDALARGGGGALAICYRETASVTAS